MGRQHLILCSGLSVFTLTFTPLSKGLLNTYDSPGVVLGGVLLNSPFISQLLREVNLNPDF